MTFCFPELRLYLGGAGAEAGGTMSGRSAEAEYAAF